MSHVGVVVGGPECCVRQLTEPDGVVWRATRRTSWDKPAELMTADEKRAAGEWLWVPDPEQVYVAARKAGTAKNRKGVPTVRAVCDDGREVTSLESEAFPLKRSSLKRLVEDLTLLDDMSAPLILHNLRKRFEAGQIYTDVGNILISVNPYQMLDLYGPDTLRRYVNRKAGQQLPPHGASSPSPAAHRWMDFFLICFNRRGGGHTVFNVAHDAYYGQYRTPDPPYSRPFSDSPVRLIAFVAFECRGISCPGDHPN